MEVSCEKRKNMKCQTCNADTKIGETQTNGARHAPPESYKDLKVIRRRRICLANKEHKFWTVEFTEDFWSEIVERVRL